MATKTFTTSWLAIYKNGFYNRSNDPFQVGGFEAVRSYIGLPSGVREALASAVGTPVLKMRVRMYDGATGNNFATHSQTYNKAGGAQPAMTNYGGNFALNVGWNTITVPAGAVAQLESGGSQGLVVHGGGFYGAGYGRTGNSNQITFIVEGEWNTPPNPSSGFTSPTASTVADQNVQMIWRDGSDAQTPTSQLRYELGYYNGSSWIEYWTLGQGVKSYLYPLGNKPETSRARFVVRTVDAQGAKSTPVYSPYFTVSHNKPPKQPYDVSPVGGKIFDRTKNLRMTWKHNDDGPQAGYQIAYRSVAPDGTVGPFVYYPASGNSFANSVSNYHDYGPNTFNLGEYEWSVRTKDQEGETSPWSTRERFYAGETSNAPIWLEPSDGAVVSSSEVVARWSSLDQRSYEIKLEEDGVEVWSETAQASNKSTRVGYDLSNERDYVLEIRVVNEFSGLWSDWAVLRFSTQFIAPSKPTIQVNTLNQDETESLEVIEVSWDAISSTVTETSRVVLMRREFNSTTIQPWEVLASQLSPVSMFIDYTVASDKTYEYAVRAWGVNDTFSESDIAEGTITLTRSFLQRALVPSDLISVNVESRTEDYTFEGAFLQFASRAKPVFEYGIAENRQIPISFTSEDIQEFRNVIEFLKRRETFLYRDNVGRRMFCVISGVSIQDKAVSGFVIDFTLTEVDFTEEER